MDNNKISYDFEQTELSRYLLVGLLTGFMSFIINLIIYFSFDREISYSVAFINIVSLMYSSQVPGVLGGIIYYLLRGNRMGTVIYIVVFASITFLSADLSFGVHYFDNSHAEQQFHGLFLSMILTIGLFTTFIIPLLVRNEKLTTKII